MLGAVHDYLRYNRNSSSGRSVSMVSHWSSSSVAIRSSARMKQIILNLSRCMQHAHHAQQTACLQNFVNAFNPLCLAHTSIPQPLMSQLSQHSVRGFPFAARGITSTTVALSTETTDYHIGLHNIRDNPGSRRQKIRCGRGDSARRGNYSGRGMKGLKARGRAHILYDGGQLGLIKYPVTRETPSYEVLYNHVGLARVVEFVQLGLLDHTKVITMRDLLLSGCVPGNIQYGVKLYGGSACQLGFPLNIQVSACDDRTKKIIEAAGGTATRVYYTGEGLKALLKPERYSRVGLPLPQPPPRWHPKHDGKFDAVGEIPPAFNNHALTSTPTHTAATAQA